MKGFKEFILRGNVVDLAVGVVIGAAFSSIIKAFVEDILTPGISLVGGQPNFSKLSFQLGKSVFHYGDFLNSLISFLIIAAVIYFLVIVPMNKLTHVMKRNDKTADPTTKKCQFCYSEIEIKATRCAFCTSQLPK